MVFMIRGWFLPYVRYVALAAIASMITSCATLELERADSIKGHELPQYWLNISLYTGRFYDDDKQILIDYRPFATIEDVKTKDGHLILPRQEDRIIQAGTLIKLIKISYPDHKNILKRPIYSPRNNVWVYVKIAKERGLVTLFREETHIMVIPEQIQNDTQVREYLGKFFSTKDPNRWILQTESYIQDGIYSKTPKIGMKKEHIIASLGPANRKQMQKEMDFDHAQEIWHYHNYLIYFAHNKVAKIKKI